MSNRILQKTRPAVPVRLAAFIGSLALIALVTALSPLERTLGSSARLVYFHGAWVWAAKIAFAAAGLAGLAGIVARRAGWQAWSRAWGLTGLVFWATYLPLSLYVQQITWGGILWDEPRWRVALAIGIVGLLLQAGLSLIDLPTLTSGANLVFAAGVWLALAETPNVLHPDNPVASSNSLLIQAFFGALLALALVIAAQVAWWIKRNAERGMRNAA